MTHVEMYQAICRRVAALNPDLVLADVLTAADELLALTGRRRRTAEEKPAKRPRAATAKAEPV